MPECRDNVASSAIQHEHRHRIIYSITSFGFCKPQGTFMSYIRLLTPAAQYVEHAL